MPENQASIKCLSAGDNGSRVYLLSQGLSEWTVVVPHGAEPASYLDEQARSFNSQAVQLFAQAKSLLNQSKTMDLAAKTLATHKPVAA